VLNHTYMQHKPNQDRSRLRHQLQLAILFAIHELYAWMLGKVKLFLVCRLKVSPQEETINLGVSRNNVETVLMRANEVRISQLRTDELCPGFGTGLQPDRDERNVLLNPQSDSELGGADGPWCSTSC
jgi:hypothetical protein